MDRECTKKVITAMQAWLNREEIQAKTATGEWYSVDEHDCAWNNVTLEYRIKPKEPREFWLCNADKPGSSYHYWVSEEDKDRGYWDDANPIKVREVIG